MRRRAAVAAAAAGGLFGWRLRGDEPAAAAPLVQVGEPAPPLALPRLQPPADLWTSATMQGQAWVLHLWASWCASCRDEHALWLELAPSVPGKALVGLVHRDDPRAALEWLARHDDPFRHVVVDRDGAASRPYGDAGVPATFVVDAAGIVRHRHVGAMTAALWRRELLPLISAAPVLAALGRSAPPRRESAPASPQRN